MGFDVLACVKFKIFMCIRSGVNRRTDRRILDSKRDFNGFSDPAIAADCGFIHFLARILDFACNKNIFARISDSWRNFNGRFGQ